MRSRGRVFFAMTLIWTLAGCGLTDRTTVDQSAVVQWPSSNDSLDFWDTLESQSVTTNDDALHGLLLLVQAEPEPANWDERVAAAQRRGWLSSATTLKANESARVGTIAVCICHILDVQGGLSMRLFGKIPRYSTRELVHMGLLPGITENEALTGSEFLALIAATEQQQWMNMAMATRQTEPTAPAMATSSAEHPGQAASTPPAADPNEVTP